ncbi:PKD domain-containing protein [Reichenbachiella sp. MALMAid0571]|uniref:PKD domain-containing protein n=1 Tax=Reichenbachiella sp. MALMAid0571 TaxID=3143939 RepID=UPI0032DEC245
MKKHRLKYFGLLIFLSLLIYSCGEDEKLEFPTSAQIFYSLSDDPDEAKKVAFTAITHSADSYLWDFGDGTTSTEPVVVHEYSDGGYYTVSLTVTGSTGTDSEEVNLAIDLTPYVLLTGGPTNTEGKKWKLSAAHGAGGNYFANSDASFSLYGDTPKPLPDGIFATEFGMGKVYDDVYTFHFDGNYEIDTKDDQAVFSGYVHQLLTGGNVVNANGASYGLVIASYTPDASATFTYVENEDFEVATVYGPEGKLTYEGVSTLDFSGTSFVGFKDYETKVIVSDVKDKSFNIVVFVSADPGAYPKATNAIILTMQAVD